MDEFDICIAGAGVVGLAICHQLSIDSRLSGRSIILLDQEDNFGKHISSRSSEVIHAGIYYQNGSFKAKLCVEGKELLYEYCKKQQIPHKKIQKLIVAQHKNESQIEGLLRKAEANGVFDLETLDANQLKKLEPSVHGSTALLSPSTGIIDSHSYMQSLLLGAQANGAEFYPKTRINKAEALQNGFRVHTVIDEQKSPQNYSFFCRQFINSCGINAQQLARRIDGVDSKYIPGLHLCKGDYFSYSKNNPFSHLIYPLPEKNESGLGIHATLDMGSQLRFGPDAEYVEDIQYDIKTEKAVLFAAAISKYFPMITAADLSPSYSGLRPKLSAAGQAAEDFVIQSERVHGIEGLIQLFGIESPGLTSSLAIAKHVNQQIGEYY
jgi:L-2-hydroxyglutarate oxidase LhgO